MTVVAAFLCSDGAVAATDSMLTSLIKNMPLAHHAGKKVSILAENQVFAFARDQGQGDRFRFVADNSNQEQISQMAHPIDYGLNISSHLIQQFARTGIGDAINLNAVLAYAH